MAPSVVTPGGRSTVKCVGPVRSAVPADTQLADMFPVVKKPPG